MLAHKKEREDLEDELYKLKQDFDKTEIKYLENLQEFTNKMEKCVITQEELKRKVEETKEMLLKRKNLSQNLIEQKAELIKIIKDFSIKVEL